jgi:hypothetical protein
MNRSSVKTVPLICIAIMVGMLIMAGCTSTKTNQLNLTKTQGQQNTGENGTNPGQTNTSSQTQNEATQQDSVTTVEKPDVKVKALYLTGWTVSSTIRLNHFIDIAKTTEINSYVLDIKDDDGYVGYDSQLPEVIKSGTSMKKYNPDKVLKAFHDNGVHVIGRIVCFKDPVYSIKRSDLAVKNTAGGLWKDKKGKTWLNPYNKNCWTYLIDIAKEGVQKGFDEIQFDYVRFPDGGIKKTMDLSGADKEKYEKIDEFLAYAKKELPNVKVSADVFGIICESPADVEGIGQNLEYVGKDVDYISPMLYPSHFALGQTVNGITFAKPDFEPYKVVYNSLIKAKDRISKVSGYNADVRPYLQDFTASWLHKGDYQSYGAEQVKAQIKAVYDAGYDEWILWDATNKYTEDALQKK